MLNTIGTFLLSLLLVGLIFIGVVILFGYLLSSKPYRGPVTDHFDGKKFNNPSGLPANGLKEVGKYGQTRQPDKWGIVEDTAFRERIIPQAESNQVQYTFINHSSFLIQIEGLNILTDPIWSERCSPFQFAGPKRMRPPGIAFQNIPPIDLVLISHNHYDHLDKGSIKKINKHHDPLYVVALGLLPLMKSWGCKNVVELDWWQETSFKSLDVKATPANHFSSRGLFDRDKTLWSGFIINTPSAKIYYAGDTGYGNVFKEIGKKEGPFDLSFIPIGAYKPEWFMGPIHISPQQAVQVHFDVKSKKSVAMHFGTFPLADDNPERSKTELIKARNKAALNESDFLIPLEGGSNQLKIESKPLS